MERPRAYVTDGALGVYPFAKDRMSPDRLAMDPHWRGRPREIARFVAVGRWVSVPARMFMYRYGRWVSFANVAPNVYHGLPSDACSRRCSHSLLLPALVSSWRRLIIIHHGSSRRLSHPGVCTVCLLPALSHHNSSWFCCSRRCRKPYVLV